MTYLSVLEKLKVLFDMITNFKIVLVFAVLMLATTIAYIIKKISKKKYMLLMLIMFILLFGISIVSNYNILTNTFDNFTTIFFRNIYFPSIYVYIVLLILVDIIFTINIASKKTRKSYKITNSIMFVLNNILFAIILNIIATNKINIFEISSLYTSTDLVAILELDMNLGVIWLFAIMTIYITNTVSDRLKVRKESKITESVASLDLSKENTNTLVLTSPDDKVDKLPLPTAESTIKMPTATSNVVEVPNVISSITPNTLILNSTKKESNSFTFDDILNGNIPVRYYEKESVVSPSGGIVNPQELYESKYQNNAFKSDAVITKTKEVAPAEVLKEPKVNISYDNLEDTIDKVEKVSNSTKVTFGELASDIKVDTNREFSGKYSIEEYKKIAEMLRKLKDRTRYSNISIDDAVAISLISNYSFEDCRKFKELLENNLNI